jgi:hypothetical protein
MKRRHYKDFSPTGWLLVQQEEKRGWLPEQITREVQSEHIRLGYASFLFLITSFIFEIKTYAKLNFRAKNFRQRYQFLKSLSEE